MAFKNALKNIGGKASKKCWVICKLLHALVEHKSYSRKKGNRVK